MTQTINNDLGIITLFAGSNVWIKPADARAAAKQHGVTLRVPDLRPIKARRAVRAARSFSNRAVKVEPVYSKTPPKFAADAKFTVLQRVVKTGEKAEWLKSDTATWNQKDGWHSENGSEDAKAFIEHAERWQTHLDYSWLRSQTVRALLGRCGAFSLFAGRAFYVHTDKLGEWDILQAMIREMCPSAGMSRIKVDGRDEQSLDGVRDAAKTSILDVVDATLTKLQEWREKQSNRPSVLNRMVEELAGARRRAKALATGLAFKVDELEAEIGRVDEMVADTLAEYEADRERPGARIGGRLPGGKIVEAIIAAYGLLGTDVATVSVLTATCEKEGLLVQTGKTPVRITVSGRLSDLIERNDPRFTKIAKGEFRFNGADATHPDEPALITDAEAEFDAANEPATSEGGADETPVNPDAVEFEVEDGLHQDEDGLDTDDGEGDEELMDVNLDEIPADIGDYNDDAIVAFAEHHGIRTRGADLDMVVSRLLAKREG